ncbi:MULTISPECIES: hypothetical protein [unclassified Bacillus cereus group]|uniref:hypothetical protein n=1 Tax=unclassified Bacillus cereus group TaxID=2750818 RepID=UPI00339B64BA
MSKISRCCLVCDYRIKMYQSPKDKYQEVTVCPKCNGAFVDMWKLEKYKQSNKGVESLLQIGLSDISAVPIVIYNGEEIKQRIRISFDWKTNDGCKFGSYIHIEHVEDSKKCFNIKTIQYNHPIMEE